MSLDDGLPSLHMTARAFATMVRGGECYGPPADLDLTVLVERHHAESFLRERVVPLPCAAVRLIACVLS